MVSKNNLLISLLLTIVVLACKDSDKFKNQDEKTLTKEERVLVDSIRSNLYSKPDRAIPYIKSFLKSSKEKGHNEKVVMGYASLAIAYDIKDDFDRCLYYYHKALSLCETSDCIITAKYDIGKVYEKRFNYKKALEFYQECHLLIKKENILDKYDKIERAMAFIDNKVGAPERAIEILEDRYEKAKKSKDPKRIRITRRDLIEVYVTSKTIGNALKMIEVGLLDAKEINNKELQFYLCKYESEVYLQKGKLDLAEKAIVNALSNAKLMENDKFMAKANYILSHINKRQNNYEVSVKVLESSLKENNLKAPEMLSKYYKLLAESYDGLGDSEMSSHYYEKHTREEKKLTEKRISTLNKTHIINLKELDFEKEEQEQKKLVWIAAFAILLIVLLIFFYMDRAKEKENQELFEVLMLRIKDNEKNKIDLEKALKQKEIDSHSNETTNLPNVKPKESQEEREDSSYVIDDEKVNEILMKINKLEEQHYFLRQDCTMHNMAKRLKTNTSYLSKIINAHFNKSFSVYINGLRINYVLIELKNNKRLRSYSVKAISEEIGYKSTDSFTKYFKKATGITPAVYIKKVSGL